MDYSKDVDDKSLDEILAELRQEEEQAELGADDYMLEILMK